MKGKFKMWRQIAALWDGKPALSPSDRSEGQAMYRRSSVWPLEIFTFSAQSHCKPAGWERPSLHTSNVSLARSLDRSIASNLLTNGIPPQPNG